MKTPLLFFSLHHIKLGVRVEYLRLNAGYIGTVLVINRASYLASLLEANSANNDTRTKHERTEIISSRMHGQ